MIQEIDDRDDDLIYRHEVWRMEHELQDALKMSRIALVVETDIHEHQQLSLTSPMSPHQHHRDVSTTRPV